MNFILSFILSVCEFQVLLPRCSVFIVPKELKTCAAIFANIFWNSLPL